jgi:hypothetical protein
MLIKAGTIGVWNTLNTANYSAKLGAKVIVTADCDTAETSLVQVKWLDELATGENGRQNDGGYYHEDIVFDAEPAYDVNKTVEIVAPQSQLRDIIEIGKMLSVLPFGIQNPLYTRPFIQDACYCAYGWNVVVTNHVINAAVMMNLFKLI